MNTNTFFSGDELRRVEDAVKQAENGISGEIVPVFVSRSDTYEQGNLRAGFLVLSFSAVVWILLYEFFSGWGARWYFTPEALISIMVFAFCAGFFLARFVAAFRLLFILEKEKAESVDKAANIAFLKEEVFNTHKRTGILIFISMLEHRVEVLGDTGISEKVTPEEWYHVVEIIVNGLKSNRKVEGICEGIQESRALLLKNGFVAAGGDTNELPNNLRVQ